MAIDGIPIKVKEHTYASGSQAGFIFFEVRPNGTRVSFEFGIDKNTDYAAAKETLLLMLSTITLSNS